MQEWDACGGSSAGGFAGRADGGVRKSCGGAGRNRAESCHAGEGGTV